MMMQVEQVMNQPAIVCRIGDSTLVAAQLMEEYDCGVIPVVNDEHVLVGIITDRDICLAAQANDEALRDIFVADVMTTQVYSCRTHDTLRHAEELMKRGQVHRLPVIDARGHVQGVLSSHDLLQECSRTRSLRGLREVLKGALSAKELVDTLAAVSRPRRPADLARPEEVALSQRSAG